MVEVQTTCGDKPIRYPSECTFTCDCGPSYCNWQVDCPGGYSTGGTILTLDPGDDEQDHSDHVTVHGNLDLCAVFLAKSWKRPVTVPERLRGKVFRRRRKLTGTREEIAKALGLTLGLAPKSRKARA